MELIDSSSSLFNRVVRSICFFSLSLVSVKDRTAYPILNKQIVRTDQEEGNEPEQKESQDKNNTGQEEAKRETQDKSQDNSKGKAKKSKSNNHKQQKQKNKKKAGRPKGSKNKDKVNVKLTSTSSIYKNDDNASSEHILTKNGYSVFITRWGLWR